MQADGVTLAAVQARKGVQALAANNQQAHLGIGAVGQAHGFAGIGHFKGQFAFELHEAKEVDFNVARSAQKRALGAVQAQAQCAGRAGAHHEGGGAIAVVHHRAVSGGAVDGQFEVLHRQAQPVHADKSSLAHIGLQASPAARVGAVGDLLGRQALGLQRESKVHAVQHQAGGVGLAAAHAGKGAQAVAAHEQLRNLHSGGGLVRARGAGQIG